MTRLSELGAMGEGLVELRPNRRVWVERRAGTAAGKFSTAGAAAVFVHGSCANAHQFEAQIVALQAQGFSTIAYDALGCGNSSKPAIFQAYRPDELFADLESVVAFALEEFNEVVLIAHSFGCCLAARLAASLRKKVAALILIGAFYPIGGSDRIGPPWIMRLPSWVLGWMQREMTKRFADMAFHTTTFTEQHALVEDEMRRSNANPPHMFRAFYLQVHEMFQPMERFEAWLRGIKAPTLIVQGAEDKLTPPVMATTIMKMLPNGRLQLVERTSHQVHQERAKEFNAIILVFLGEAIKP